MARGRMHPTGLERFSTRLHILIWGDKRGFSRVVPPPDDISADVRPEDIWDTNAPVFPLIGLHDADQCPGQCKTRGIEHVRVSQCSVGLRPVADIRPPCLELEAV
ncbi:MAG: hypothetical protein R3B97_15465 [Dehalococcoidia bacterium]